MSNYDEVKYNDLKKLAKERGLDASGTKEVLKERLIAADGAGAPAPAPADATPAPVAEGSQDPAPAEAAPAAPATPADEPAPTQTTPAEEKALEKSATRQLRKDAQKMKEHLEAQPKVSIMIPFEAGESPENGKLIPFHVNLNGYKQDYPRGQYIEVPKQIADLIKERLESEGKIGEQWRLDRDPKKMEALG
jgi:hypothetical protein